MSDEQRTFRSEASKAAERRHRSVLQPFLETHGYRVTRNHLKKRGDAIEQFIDAEAPDGTEIRARVRLCWHRGGEDSSEHLFSAAQLIARLREPGNWAGTLDYLDARERRLGLTHMLLSQDDSDGRILFVAFVPANAVKPIWERQRDVAEELLASPHARRVKKNQVRNGQSPTIWLQDDRREDSHLIAEVFWNWPGVSFLESSPRTLPMLSDPALTELAGRDGADVIIRTVLSYPRDPEVRREVLRRAEGRCERPGCGASRSWTPFLDVHHVLGVAESDRARNCVALCPNCHREAHYGTSKTLLNAELLAFAETASERSPTS